MKMKGAAPAKKEVGIWVRVSTEDQAKGDSPEHHLERAKAYALVNGWAVKEIYDLAGNSGTSGKSVKDHPEGKRMLADVKRGHITGLIFSKLARLARNTRELLDFSDYFRAHNADLISLQDNIDTSTPSGRMFYTLQAAQAQWEREEIADRVRASISIRAKLGKSLGGAAPFGYEWRDKKLHPHPAEAPVRKLMYELFAKHKRAKTVARMLNEAGYRTRKGARFTDTTVVRLLKDQTAKGQYLSNHTQRTPAGKLVAKPKAEWVFTPVEPIVSEEIWKECNEALNRRRNSAPVGPKPVHLFAGLLFCGCGQKMYVFTRTPKYICCKCRNKIPMEDIELIIRDELEAFFVSQDKVRAHLTKAGEHLASKQAQLAAHGRQLERTRTEMRKVYRLYQEDQLTPDGFGKLYRPLEDQEKSLASEHARLQGEVEALKMQQISADEVVAEAITLHKMWPKFTQEEKRRIIESIVEKITLTGDTIDITYCYLPSSEELTKRQRNLSGSSPPRA